VNLALAQRQIALAGLALLAGILALGLSSTKHASGPKLPESIPAPNGGWFQAVATSSGPTFSRKHLDGACGDVVGPGTQVGVANPVLPCGTKVYIEYGDTKTLTQVIARTPSTSEADFEFPPALAREIGLHGNQLIGWRYAR
jgi:hypothetical protein